MPLDKFMSKGQTHSGKQTETQRISISSAQIKNRNYEDDQLRKTETIIGHNTLDRGSNSSVNLSVSQKQRQNKESQKPTVSSQRINSDLLDSQGRLLVAFQTQAEQPAILHTTESHELNKPSNRYEHSEVKLASVEKSKSDETVGKTELSAIAAPVITSTSTGGPNIIVTSRKPAFAKGYANLNSMQQEIIRQRLDKLKSHASRREVLSIQKVEMQVEDGNGRVVPTVRTNRAQG